MALVASSVVLDYLNPSAFRQAPLSVIALFKLLSLAYPTVGAMVASRRPRNPIGWILCCAGLLSAVQIFASGYADYAWPDPLPGARYMAWMASWVTLPTVMLTTVLLLLLFPSGRLPSGLLFPEGRLPARSWLVVVWMAACGSAIVAFDLATRPGRLETQLSLGLVWPSYPVDNPFGDIGGSPSGITDAILSIVAHVGLYLFFVSFVFALVTLISRFVLSRGEERQQIKWFMVAVVLLIGGFPVSLIGGLPLAILLGIDAALWNIGLAASMSGFLLLPVTLVLAILKYRLYGIDRVVNRTLVYGLLTACVVGLYVLMVAGAGALFQGRVNVVVSLLATGLVALLFHPLRARLQRAVNRLMYGQRDEPYAVLSRLGERLGERPAPEESLSTVVETVVRALKLPYAAITLEQDGKFVAVAERGSPAANLVTLPLVYHAEEVGQLLVAPRTPGEEFAPADRRLLDDLAHQAGATAHAARLTADLQRSRERLVTAREEERRRLRRDLHDGVGPQLAALMLELETAGDLVSGDPEASALMGKLSRRARDTASDVRRSVHALRPPALDELGLLGALRETAVHYGRGGLAVSVEAPVELPPLPAAVEVACYRIAQEAMTNVVRHAGAGNCWVRIAPDGGAGLIRLEVEDD
ncbi:MAG: histidine kinase, partial [Actinomycetota bacterium]|nr:histidine kinase [Actinomycetota bacterium]